MTGHMMVASGDELFQLVATIMEGILVATDASHRTAGRSNLPSGSTSSVR